MRTITGTTKSTPVRWLPTLSNIVPPDIRRSAALAREHQKIMSNERLPIHEEAPLITQGRQRLKSRHPPIRTASKMTDEFNMEEQRTERWLPTTESDYIQINNPEPGFNGSTLPRSTWSKLNRIRTGHG
ncbi:hypothetical protein JTB14_027672 [Gonioctena quinquepunctata]|nr:hypothetical protein JTB14_027672 [Gonioctena quinquepunctata]